MPDAGYIVVEGYSWSYKTVFQPELGTREIAYSRGKGLGGSTANNYCVYTRGPSADYDHWSALVEDTTWAWENVEKRVDRVEEFHDPISEASGYVAVTDDTPGKDVGVTEVWDPGFDEFIKNAYHSHPKNNNHNSGDPIGISVCQLSNLFLATSEFYTSGIGPSQDLSVLDIPVVQDLPGVGKNLQDRLFLELVTVQDPESHHRTSYIDIPVALEQARKEWTKNKSGPLSDYYLSQMIAYLKSDKVASSQESKVLMTRLDNSCTQNPSTSVKAPEKYFPTAVAFPGNHGSGSVRLASSNSDDPPFIDPNILFYPFDRGVAIGSVRDFLAFLKQPLMAKGSLRFAAGPDGDSDEEILVS
ncbi:MAG: hypothetical protein Q9198_000135 [Flavoplaca austrocitrina]